jgi:hypothetical protein
MQIGAEEGQGKTWAGRRPRRGPGAEEDGDGAEELAGPHRGGGGGRHPKEAGGTPPREIRWATAALCL